MIRLWLWFGFILHSVFVPVVVVVLALPAAIYRMLHRLDNWCHHFQAAFSLAPNAHANKHAPVDWLSECRKSCNRPIECRAMQRTMTDVSYRHRYSIGCYGSSYLWHVRFGTKPTESKWNGKNFKLNSIWFSIHFWNAFFCLFKYKHCNRYKLIKCAISYC